MDSLISMRELTGGEVQKSKKFFRDHTYVMMEKLPSRASYQCTLICHGCGVSCVMRFQIPGRPQYASVARCVDQFSSLCKKLDMVQVEYHGVLDGQPLLSSDANNEEK